MSEQHTPGPWHIGRRFIVYGPHGEQVADCSTVTNFADENRANARLIVAAPDLLAACEKAEASLLSSNPLDFKVGLAAIRAAIAKTRGEG